MDFAQWLTRNFQMDSLHRGEALLLCPRCQKIKLYFNIRKRVGHCHYASCAFHIQPVLLQDLINIVGYGPDSDEGWLIEDEYGETTSQAIVLPEASQELVYMEKGQLLTRYPTASQAVSARGVNPEDQHRFRLHFDGLYVYIPVYLDGKLVSYIGRKSWWFHTDAIRYNNASGSLTNSCIFNWNEAQGWNRLTLVENTFNAIWLRHRIQTSSTFGAHLSEEQALMISRGPFESVAFLWDQGSEQSAGKAVETLKTEYGIPACAGWLTGQPDDHELDFVVEAAEAVHKAALEGRSWIRI